MPDINAVRRGLLKSPPDFEGVRTLLEVPDGTILRLPALELKDLLHVKGSLIVEGSLVFGVDAMLWVRGECEAGTIYSHDFDYSFLGVGGRLKAGRIRTGGEIMALGGIEADVLWTSYNGYSTYAPEAKLGTYVAEDRFDVIPKLAAERRFTDHRLPAEVVRAWFPGLSDREPDALRRYFLGGGA